MTQVAMDPRRACRVTVLAAALLAALAGCEITPDDAPAGRPAAQRGGSASDLIESRRAAFQIDHEAYAAIGYGIDWRGFPVVPARQRMEHLNLYEDIVLAQETGSTLSVLEASTGALRNSSQVASPLTRFVGIVRIGDRAVVSSDNRAYEVDLETGDLVERHVLNRVVSTHPVYYANQLIYGTSIGHVYSRYLAPPVDSWAFDLGSPIDARPVLVGGTLVAISRRGDIAILDASSGTLLSRAAIYGGSEADPVAGEGMVYFASLDQSIYGFGLDGRQVWRVRTEQPLRQTPTYHAGTLYVPSEDQGLRAHDALTGVKMWNNQEISGRVIGLRNGNLLTWDGTTASLLDPATGDVVESAELEGVGMLKTDRFEDGNLYAVSRGGIIAKFAPRD